MKDFNSNFTRLFPERPPLFLTSKNEFGVDKFVCTSVRPTQLQYREMYDVKKCATFVAHYLDYEPLENPTEPPTSLPSSTQVLDWTVGDSFDFANVLCSYLLGAGYDAYIVMGYAPKDVCERDQTSTACPFLVEAKDESKSEESAANVGDEAKDEEEGTSYVAKRHGTIESKFLTSKGKEEVFDGPMPKPKFKSEPIKWDSDDEDENAVEQLATSDKLHGKRVHAWVLVRGGKRDVEEMLFVEPTTARIYPVSESPYLGIESVWNSKNYWVNMQRDEELIAHSYDFANPDLWEFVFIDSGVVPLVVKEADRSLMDLINDPSAEDRGEPEDEGDGEGKAPKQIESKSQKKEKENSICVR